MTVRHKAMLKSSGFQMGVRRPFVVRGGILGIREALPHQSSPRQYFFFFFYRMRRNVLVSG